MQATTEVLPRSRRSGPSAALAAVGVALLLAACSSNKAASTTTSEATSTTAAVHAPTTVTTIPFSIAKNARQDVTTTGSCSDVGGHWVLHGVVKNSAKAARAYQIVVDFVSRPGNTVLDTKIVNTASIKPGGSLSWSAKSTSGLTHVACVIRQVQAPA